VRNSEFGTIRAQAKRECVDVFLPRGEGLGSP